jgi:hypothetical protein
MIWIMFRSSRRRFLVLQSGALIERGGGEGALHYEQNVSSAKKILAL